MQTHYSPRLRYECARSALDYGKPICGSLPGETIERLAADQILTALQPASLDLSLAALGRIEAERAETERHWKLRLQRAQQDADRAHRQYDAVEPENRLVARTLEHRWEEALRSLRELREEYDRFLASRPTTLSTSERKAILELSTKLPDLWHAPTTTVADKRRVVQLMLERVVVTSAGERVSVELHWAGGTATRHEATRPVARWSALTHYADTLDQIKQMADAGSTSQQIADSLNQRGLATCRGKPFTCTNIRQLCSRAAALLKNT
jgi:hypothetical protein